MKINVINNNHPIKNEPPPNGVKKEKIEMLISFAI